MEDLELLQGTVAAVVYQNAENGYAVLRLSCGGQAVSVVGTIPLPVPGSGWSSPGGGPTTPITASSLRRSFGAAYAGDNAGNFELSPPAR